MGGCWGGGSGAGGGVGVWGGWGGEEFRCQWFMGVLGALEALGV